MLFIALAHLGFLAMLGSDPIEVRRIQPESPPIVVDLLLGEFADAEIPLEESAASDPKELLDPPQLPADAFAEPQLEVPRIDPDMQLVGAPFAARAQLEQGEVITAILLLQVGADGKVISAKVVRSNGDDTANEAAIEYARATRWIPGSIDGEPCAMQASLTVILGEK